MPSQSKNSDWGFLAIKPITSKVIVNQHTFNALEDSKVTSSLDCLDYTSLYPYKLSISNTNGISYIIVRNFKCGHYTYKVKYTSDRIADIDEHVFTPCEALQKTGKGMGGIFKLSINKFCLILICSFLIFYFISFLF